MKSHKDLDIWKMSIELVKTIYVITNSFPKEEIYGLTSQIRRTAVSIPSNLAERSARNGKRELKRFIYISLGSLSELDTQLIISYEIGYLDEKSFGELNKSITQIRKMLFGLLSSLN